MAGPAEKRQTALVKTGGAVGGAPELRALEKIVQDNAKAGAALWRKAADALLQIKDKKLWKIAKPRDDAGPYKSFVDYAERRFGFRKTYAYDLVKAATHKPEALTEGEARAAMAAEKPVKPLTAAEAVAKIDASWTTFENRVSNFRDRAIDNTDFVKGYDTLMREVGEQIRHFVQQWTPIEGEAIAVEPTTEKVSPKRAKTTDEQAAATA